MQITVTRRDGTEHVILFDDADAERLLQYRWAVWAHPKAPKLFYTRTNLPRPMRGSVTMHRMLLPDTQTVDHINHNGLDNRRINLRPASSAQQAANQRSRRGSSQFKGVSWDARNQKWLAGITIDYKTQYLGLFTSETDAARAYDDAARETWGEYAFTNGDVR